MPSESRSLGWTVANVVMLAMYLFSVVVQFNDPDPLLWSAVYGAAAVACALELAGRNRAAYSGAIAALTALWAINISPRVLGHVPFTDMFGAWEMKNAGIEESREMYGLLIVAVWMTVLTVAAVRRRRTT